MRDPSEQEYSLEQEQLNITEHTADKVWQLNSVERYNDEPFDCSSAIMLIAKQ